jgi:Ca2+-binding RTX toxin-like protein
MPVITGKNGGDTLTGGSSDDTITGGNGNDRIYSGDGADSIDGGDGNDQINGYPTTGDFYTYWTYAGTKTINGGNGDDFIYGSDGADSLIGGAGNDSIYGSSGNDTLEGGLGNDNLSGGAGNDLIQADAGDDTVNKADDTGNDTVYGGAGNDLINYYLVSGNKTVAGDDGADTVYGANGNDSISGGNGNDSLFGYAGNDILDGGQGNDTLSGGAGNDSVSGGEGNDPDLDGGEGNDTIAGGDGNDTIWGSSGDDYLDAGNGNDKLYGGVGNDTFVGGAGDDYLSDSGGNNNFDAGLGNDTVLGDAGNDTINGGDGNDKLYAYDGNDFLYGGNGDDTLSKYDQIGNSVLEGGTGSDTIWGGLGSDTIIGGEGNDPWLEGYAGDDSIIGGGGNDELFGDTGNDTLDGGAGNDILHGGLGNDIYYVDSTFDYIYDSGGTDTAYVSTSFVKVPSTVENVIYTNGALALPYWISALLTDQAAGNQYLSFLGGSNSFGYIFPSSLPSYDTNKDHANGFTSFSATQKSRTVVALNYIESVIDLTFTEKTNADSLNTLTFASNKQNGSGGYARFPDNSYSGSDLFLNIADYNTTLGDGTFGAYTLMHELGHALGLKHPFDEKDSTGDVEVPPYLQGSEDSTTWTYISYNYSSSEYYLRYSPLDIAALQYLYGPSKSARLGNDKYTISSSSANFIWDGAGTDQIDASQAYQATTIYLTPGYWGYLGSNKTSTITSAGQITVNFGSVIENLIGSNYDDYLYGNEVGNKVEGGAGNDSIEGWDGADTLIGGAGKDTLFGGAGNDSIEGGDGNDTLVVSGLFSNYIIRYDSATLSYSIEGMSGTDGKDTFKAVEFLKFSDKTLSLQSIDVTPPTYSVIAQNLTEDEGQVAFFNVVTTKVNSGTVLQYTISGVSPADISGGLLSGNVTIGSDGTGRISVGLLADYLTEGPETIKVTLEGKSASALINDKFVNKGPAASDLVYVFKSEKVGVGINPASYSYFYTTNTQEASSIKAQTNWPWVEKAATFEAAHSILNLAVPVFRFWSEKFQAHFFTINKDEKDQIISWSQSGKNGYEWKYEGENFKVYTSTSPTDDLGKSAIPVYRIWMDDKDFNPANGISGGHYFTANKTEYDAMIKLTGVVGEGVAFYGEVPGN